LDFERRKGVLTDALSLLFPLQTESMGWKVVAFLLRFQALRSQLLGEAMGLTGVFFGLFGHLVRAEVVVLRVGSRGRLMSVGCLHVAFRCSRMLCCWHCDSPSSRSDAESGGNANRASLPWLKAMAERPIETKV
jgi:hypothetical protein